MKVTCGVQDFPATGLPVLSNRAMVESNAFANPHNNSVTVTQPDGGVALDPHDSRLTQVSNMDGMLWTGAGISAGPDKEGKGCRGRNP